MSIVEMNVSIPSEHETNVFGQFDQHVKKIERALNVTIVNREGSLKVIGSETSAGKAIKNFLHSWLNCQNTEISFRSRMLIMQSRSHAKIKKKHFR